MDKIDTGLKDSEGNTIYTGDILDCEDGFMVYVYQDKNDGAFLGALICEVGHSCREVPYSLGDGQDYTQYWARFVARC